MTSGFSALTRLALLSAAGAMIAASLATSASAQSSPKPKYDKRGRPANVAVAPTPAPAPSGPNAVYQQGPHTRIYVSKRSWLDGGTEVLPGDRKFTDYAFPPDVGYPSFARENGNRPIDRSPLNPASDLGGVPTRFPLY